MKYENKNIDDLIPYANNARTHSSDQVNKIASSIKEFGFVNPVLIDKENGIIAGHGRVEAAKKLSMKEVPTLLVDHLSESQKKAYILADNRLALDAGWDEDILSIEIQSLDENGFDLDLTGFDESEIADFLGSDEQEDNIYTDKIDTPNYEPAGEKPDISEVLSTEQYDDLIKKIDDSNISNDEKYLLRLAATRFIKFDYKRVADYYAHSDSNTQDIMENLALVIIDYNKALENGFIQLNKDMSDQFIEENHDG